MPDEKDGEALWPQGAHKPNTDKLLDLVKEIADAETQKKIYAIEKEAEKNKRIAESNGDLTSVPDMPESVLDGILGEVCGTYMLTGKRFPLAFAWPALLAVASTLAPRYQPKQRLNLYSAIIGPVGSGKSQAVEAATQLLGLEPPALLNLMAGSAEGLIRKCKDANGEARLFSPDELGHLLEKSKIENASFPYVLNRAFYHTQFDVSMSKKEQSQFNAMLSIVGGLVTDRFEDLFGHTTTAGLYDRFLFGLCPNNFKFSYFPFEVAAKTFKLTSVGIAPDVWIEKEIWIAENPELESRVVEIAIRAAAVCASFSGKTLLLASDLAPARALAEYEQKIRNYLKPNEGENPEAKIGSKIMAYLKRLGGREVTKRKLFHDCGAERCGLSIANRALKAMVLNDDVYMTPVRERPCMVRLIIEDEGEEG
jgi:hypothetical protein